MAYSNSVLMVDDDHDDIFLTRRAFKGIDFSGKFESVTSAAELFERLGLSDDKNGSGASGDGKLNLPDIVILDLNMPGQGGFDVLERLRDDQRLNQLPVVVLSTSQSEQDVKRAYALGANSFITKPSTNEGMKNMARRFRDYWFGLSVLPALT